MYHFTEDLYGVKGIYTTEEKFTRKEMEKIYNEEIDHEIYQWFENWMYEMRRSGNVYQDYPSEEELKAYAKEQSETIMIRSEDEHGSHDERRETTKRESEILENIIYGTLLAVRWGAKEIDGNIKVNYDKLHACTDTAEFVTQRFLPDCNAYNSVYYPINGFYFC